MTELPELSEELKKEAREFREKKIIEEPNNIFTNQLQKLHVLEDKKLFNIITEEEFDKTIVGEYPARKTIFLSTNVPLVKNRTSQGGLMVNSTSTAGKSFVCKNIVDILPIETIQYRTKITPQALTYWHDSKREPNWSWDPITLYLEDISNNVLNCEPFKLMCSEGSTATVVINQRAVDIVVKGKPFMLITTANPNPSLEVMNRFSSVSLDEGSEQTHEILKSQAREAEKGTKNPYDKDIVIALAKLRRVFVRIPFASKCVDHFPLDIRIRRDFPRFLDFIRASTALYQYQRKQDEEGYYLSEPYDYELAKGAFETIISSSITGLTHQLTKAYNSTIKLFEEVNSHFSVKEIHAYDPSVSLKMWYLYLDELCSKNLLITRLEEKESSTKKVLVYAPKECLRLKLPTYDEL